MPYTCRKDSTDGQVAEPFVLFLLAPIHPAWCGPACQSRDSKGILEAVFMVGLTRTQSGTVRPGKVRRKRSLQ